MSSESIALFIGQERGLKMKRDLCMQDGDKITKEAMPLTGTRQQLAPPILVKYFETELSFVQVGNLLTNAVDTMADPHFCYHVYDFSSSARIFSPLALADSKSPTM